MMLKSIRSLLLLLLVLAVFALPGCFGGGGVNPNPTLPDPLPPTPGDDYTPPSEITGGLDGYIYEVNEGADAVPAVNATVSLIGVTGNATTDASGYFNIEGIVAGEYLAIIDIRGTKGTGSVKIVAGKTTRLTVEMYVGESGSPPPVEGTGTIQVIAYPRWAADGSQVGVKKIVISEQNNWSHRWTKDFYENMIFQTYEWEQTGIPKGKTYNIDVYWYDDSHEYKWVNLNWNEETVYVY